MVVALHANLARSRLARDLLERFAWDRGVDLLVLCEQHRDEGNRFWFRDLTGTTAIRIQSRARLSVTESGAGRGFV